MTANADAALESTWGIATGRKRNRPRKVTFREDHCEGKCHCGSGHDLQGNSKQNKTPLHKGSLQEEAIAGQEWQGNHIYTGPGDHAADSSPSFDPDYQRIFEGKVWDIGGVDESGPLMNMTFQVTDSKKPLLSVRRIVEKGNHVHFGPSAADCFISNPQSGKKLPLKFDGVGTWVMEVELSGETTHITVQQFESN